MNKDKQLLEETYQVILEGKPFGIGSKIGSTFQKMNPFSSTSRAKGQAASNFATNVNRYYDQFNAWLVSQPDQRATVGNLVKYFNDSVGLPLQKSPTLTKLTQTNPQAVTQAYNEFTQWLQSRSAATTAQPAAAQPTATQLAVPQQAQQQVAAGTSTAPQLSAPQ